MAIYYCSIFIFPTTKSFRTSRSNQLQITCQNLLSKSNPHCNLAIIFCFAKSYIRHKAVEVAISIYTSTFCIKHQQHFVALPFYFKMSIQTIYYSTVDCTIIISFKVCKNLCRNVYLLKFCCPSDKLSSIFVCCPSQRVVFSFYKGILNFPSTAINHHQNIIINRIQYKLRSSLDIFSIC